MLQAWPKRKIFKSQKNNSNGYEFQKQSFQPGISEICANKCRHTSLDSLYYTVFFPVISVGLIAKTRKQPECPSTGEWCVFLSTELTKLKVNQHSGCQTLIYISSLKNFAWPQKISRGSVCKIILKLPEQRGLGCSRSGLHSGECLLNYEQIVLRRQKSHSLERINWKACALLWGIWHTTMITVCAK